MKLTNLQMRAKAAAGLEMLQALKAGVPVTELLAGLKLAHQVALTHRDVDPFIEYAVKTRDYFGGLLPNEVEPEENVKAALGGITLSDEEG